METVGTDTDFYCKRLPRFTFLLVTSLHLRHGVITWGLKNFPDTLRTSRGTSIVKAVTTERTVIRVWLASHGIIVIWLLENHYVGIDSVILRTSSLSCTAILLLIWNFNGLEIPPLSIKETRELT